MMSWRSPLKGGAWRREDHFVGSLAKVIPHLHAQTKVFGHLNLYAHADLGHRKQFAVLGHWHKLPWP